MGPQLPKPVVTEGKIVGLQWPCGHVTDDPGDDRCPTCAAGVKVAPKPKRAPWLRAAAI
jgi:hypothetical protein